MHRHRNRRRHEHEVQAEGAGMNVSMDTDTRVGMGTAAEFHVPVSVKVASFPDVHSRRNAGKLATVGCRCSYGQQPRTLNLKALTTQFNLASIFARFPFTVVVLQLVL